MVEPLGKILRHRHCHRVRLRPTGGSRLLPLQLIPQHRRRYVWWGPAELDSTAGESLGERAGWRLVQSERRGCGLRHWTPWAPFALLVARAHAELPASVACLSPLQVEPARAFGRQPVDRDAECTCCGRNRLARKCQRGNREGILCDLDLAPGRA
eukprot:scaffold8631_cov108-Isochrysis_galbana.AAC.24